MSRVVCIEDAFYKTEQMNALLHNIFQHGAEGIEADNDLVGLALDLSTDVVNFLKKESEKNDKHR
ncbi:hypothetical protein ERHA54_35350 [Erwinia rhapontici]|uniref:hypothetical protein n=1 Tax=Erwinia rhapontici TaxID=55212 RepID=UPI001BB43CEF|nr:hypothetical protein [Erwinia rhapontici]BCQ40932.1 hypothetical protein ERHA54_35350 [Erwinia rhapontici]